MTSDVQRKEWLVKQGLPPDTYAAGRCMKCRGWIVTKTAQEWRTAVRKPCPHCGMRHW